MNILYPVIAVNRDGVTIVLDTIEDVRNFIRGKKVGVYFLESTWVWGKDRRPIRGSHGGLSVGYYTPKEHDWILRDDRGRKVDPREKPITREYDWVDDRLRSRQHAAAKGLPIPGIRKRKRRKCHCIESCGGSHNDARSARITVDINCEENDFD